jgi:ABC-type polysaccharide/polyol phosphate export permease
VGVFALDDRRRLPLNDAAPCGATTERTTDSIARCRGRAPDPGKWMPATTGTIDAQPSAARPALVPQLWRHARELFARRETIRYLTISGLQAGHRDKLLGNLWNLLDPLLFMLVYYFVFGFLFAMNGGGKSVTFMLYIFTGVLTFRFLDGTLNQAANCIRGNRGLIHEINFPKAVFPISVALARLYDFLWGLAVLVVFLLMAQLWPTTNYIWLPVLVLVLLCFLLGLAFLVAYLGAFFADTTNVVTVALRLLFYCSPIFYAVRPRGQFHVAKAFSNPTAQTIYLLNPISAYLECLRDVLLWRTAPDPGMLTYVACVALVVLLAGFAVFVQGEGKFAKYV